jgi:DNA-binding transcriptional LysR family regulator
MTGAIPGNRRLYINGKFTESSGARRLDVTSPSGWRSTNVETIRSMVARSLGYTIIMGRPSGDRTCEDLPLAYRRIADDVPPNSVVITYPEGTIPTAKVRTLIAFCRHEFAKEGQLMLRVSSEQFSISKQVVEILVIAASSDRRT